MAAWLLIRIVINLLTPFDNEYLIEDIAHHLAFNCRWNGATKSYYSVAEHCCRMYDRLPQPLKKTGLFHDGEEAYWGDVIKPLKNLLSPELREHMRNTRKAIFKAFDVPPITAEVKEADFEELKWDFDNLILSKRPTYSPEQAEQAWLERYFLTKFK